MNTTSSARVMDFSEVLRTNKKKNSVSVIGIGIYHEIENTLRIPGLAALRGIAVEACTNHPSVTMASVQESMRSLLREGKVRHLIARRNEQALLNNKDGVWDRMVHLEWELEVQDSIFIKENVEALRDGDIIVGNYFTVDQIRQLITSASSSQINFPEVEVVGSYKEVQDRVECFYRSLNTEVQGFQGVQVKECRQAEWTQHEQNIYDAAAGDLIVRILTETMRYCRLRYGGEPELAIQHFGNGPFLFLCAHWLMRKCIKERIDCMLLASRDCCLLGKMLRRFQELSTNSIFKKCEINLYYCSKNCFENNSPSFLQYTRQLLNNKNKAIYVNLWGFQPVQKKFFSHSLHWPLQVIFLVSRNDRVQNITSMYEEDSIDSNPILEYLNHDIEGPVVDVSDTFQPLRTTLRYDPKDFIQSSYSHFDSFMAQITADMVNGILTENSSQSLTSLLMDKMRGCLPMLRKKIPLVLEVGLEDDELDDVSRQIQKSLERKTTLSFDMFDTLVFRRGRLPKSIFVQVGEKLNDPDFCTKRIEAERQSNYGTYDEIYRKYQELHPNEDALHLQKMEFQTELENLYPILPTFLYLKPQDIIVSDMYLSEDHLRQILVRCFELCWSLVPKDERYRFPIFRYSVIDKIPIVVSLHGKSQKWIWGMLQKNNTIIDCHIGDNYHSDVISPLEYGIRALHFSSAQIETHTPIEGYLHERDQHALANLCRHVRLLNPYSDFRKKIYEEQSQINIPILVLLAIHLHSLNKRVLFMLRDGFYLKMIYDALYPGNDSEYLFCSRKAMKISSPSFVNYMKKKINCSSENPERKTVIFDLFGTGKSIWQFLQKYEVYHVDIFYFLIYECSECPRPPHLFLYNNDYIEMMNFTCFGSAIDIDECGQKIRQSPEYDSLIIRVIQQAIHNALFYVVSFRENILSSKEFSTLWLKDIYDKRSSIMEIHCPHYDNLNITLPDIRNSLLHVVMVGNNFSSYYFEQCAASLKIINDDDDDMPRVIFERLQSLNDGDILLYLNFQNKYTYSELDFSTIESRIYEILNRINNDVIVTVKLDPITRLDSVCPDIHPSFRNYPLLDDRCILIRKSNLSINFVQEWLQSKENLTLLYRTYMKKNLFPLSSPGFCDSLWKDDIKHWVPLQQILKVPTFQVLIATTGRSSLQNMLCSLMFELKQHDCLTIVYDGNKIPEEIKVFLQENFKCQIDIYEEPIPLGFWGHGIRNKYASLLSPRDFVLHADDDDNYVRGVFDYLRTTCVNTDTLYIGKMYFGKYAWKEYMPDDSNNIEIGNISTQCGIIPFNLNNCGEQWGNFYGGDGAFYMGLQKKTNSLVFLDKIIYIGKEYLSYVSQFKTLSSLSAK